MAREASGLAANPFESVLRAIALDVPGLDLRPQVVIAEGGWVGRPDLVDTERRLVVEAESFEFHGRRAALRRDCERYTALTLLGWTVLRFAWEHVMFEPAYVAECLRRRGRTGDSAREAPGGGVRGRAYLSSRCGQRSPPGTQSTSPVARLACRARMNSRSESRLRYLIAARSSVGVLLVGRPGRPLRPSYDGPGDVQVRPRRACRR